MRELSSTRDPLTGLRNRAAGMAALEKAVEEKRDVGLILCDVDHMSSFNCCLGHAAGDEKLRETARSIQLWAADGAVVCRLGSDEFVAICPDLSLAETKQRAEAIHAHQRPASMEDFDNGKYLALTLSIGVAHFPTHVESAQALLCAADLALLKVKRGGRIWDGTPRIERNRVVAIGDFLDEFPDRSAGFLKASLKGWL